MMISIEPIFAHECQIVLHAYYGGPLRAGWYLLRYGITLKLNSWYWRFVWWISDKIGWTKISHVPETEDYMEHWRRHGRKCSASPNCSGDCIGVAVPRWYKRITKIDRYDI